MEDLSLHVMDIAENSITSGASAISIRTDESVCSGRRRLVLLIEDNGRGMSEEEIERALDPFYTSKEGKRVGLGLPLFRQAAVESGGDMTVESIPGSGIRVRAEFDPDHPDMKPLGDLEGTIALLKVFHPEVTFSFEMTYEESTDQGGKDETET